MHFREKLARSWDLNGSLLCVGLDPDPSRLPPSVSGDSKPIFAFNRAIIDATAGHVCAYKPQFAYYAAAAAEDELAMTIDYIHEQHPSVLVILDAKRGDIGSTARMYAAEAFDRYGADAVTVNPYMGGDTLEPFLERADRGVIVLCRTSNPGAAEFQQLHVDGVPLYLRVAEHAAEKWNANGNVMLVVGATAPDELSSVRTRCPSIPLLVPGVGAQGGDLERVVTSGADSEQKGLVINSSRGIIYASGGTDFAEAAGTAARDLNEAINRHRAP